MPEPFFKDDFARAFHSFRQTCKVFFYLFVNFYILVYCTWTLLFGTKYLFHLLTHDTNTLLHKIVGTLLCKWNCGQVHLIFTWPRWKVQYLCATLYSKWSCFSTTNIFWHAFSVPIASRNLFTRKVGGHIQASLGIVKSSKVGRNVPQFHFNFLCDNSVKPNE